MAIWYLEYYQPNIRIRKEIHMNITEKIYRELAKLGLLGDIHIYLQEIRNKDGIYLFRGGFKSL